MSGNDPLSVTAAETVPVEGRVRVRTLVLTRWLAIFGQVIALLVVSEGLNAALPMGWAMATVACSAALNIWVSFRYGLNRWYSNNEAAVYLGYDIVQLSALLYLTGGLENPFCLLFLVPVTISAMILSLGSTISLVILTTVCFSILVSIHLPLPWPGGRLSLPPVYLIGTWFALASGMTFLAFYAWRVAEESRRMSDALRETQIVLAREQELSSLGGLAAAAAHELGTPLSTIVLVANELSRELPSDSEYREDIELLHSQAGRCREILARLAADPSGGRDPILERMPLQALVAAIAEPRRRDGIRLNIESTIAEGVEPPVVWRGPELLQGLANLIENAIDFARTEVMIRIIWDGGELGLEIADDGPGFAAGILGLLGDPYVSTRRERGGMGLGVFISKTLLQRTGATLRFGNRERGRGAIVAISWPRGTIGVEPPGEEASSGELRA